MARNWTMQIEWHDRSFGRQAQLSRGSYGGPDVGENKEKGVRIWRHFEGEIEVRHFPRHAKAIERVESKISPDVEAG